MKTRSVNWEILKKLRPDLAAAGQELFYQYGLGLAFLATIRRNGGPRLHPICPVITKTGLYAFIIPSPKEKDLIRDGRLALHSYASEDNEDAFYFTGRAVPVKDLKLRTKLEEQFQAERPGLDFDALDMKRQSLFEFLIETVLLTRTKGHGDPDPKHDIWHAEV